MVRIYSLRYAIISIGPVGIAYNFNNSVVTSLIGIEPFLFPLLYIEKKYVESIRSIIFFFPSFYISIQGTPLPAHSSPLVKYNFDFFPGGRVLIV